MIFLAPQAADRRRDKNNTNLQSAHIFNHHAFVLYCMPRYHLIKKKKAAAARKVVSGEDINQYGRGFNKPTNRSVHCSSSRCNEWWLHYCLFVVSKGGTVVRVFAERGVAVVVVVGRDHSVMRVANRPNTIINVLRESV